HRDILGERDAEGDIDLEVRGLAHHADRIGLRVQQRGKSRIIRGAAAGTAGHAEGDELRALEARLVAEEGVVGRVRAGPAAFNVIHTQAIERDGERLLVADIEVDALSLRTIAQGRVEQVNAFVVRHNCQLGVELRTLTRFSAYGTLGVKQSPNNKPQMP